ncbi:MAG: tetratricopeptide repeat protein [Pseudomonadota bacterium]
MATFRFDQFEFDEERRQLRQGRDPVAIQPRVFELLRYLIAHRDRAVSKDELIEAVWPGQVITDAALARAIMKARKAVDDDATRQAVIHTVTGHGYRLVAEVTELAIASPTLPPAPTPESGSVHAGRRLPMRGIGVAVLLLLVVGLLAVFRPSESRPALRLAVLPIIDTTAEVELAWARLGLMGLIGDIIRASEFPVIDEQEIVFLTDRAGWPGGDEQAERRITQEAFTTLGASHVLMARLEGSATGRYGLSWRLEDRDGSVDDGRFDGESPTELARLAADNVIDRFLVGDMQVPPLPAVSGDRFIDEAYARATSDYLSGDCPKARALLEVVISQQPQLVAPRIQLGDCERIAGNLDRSQEILRGVADEQLAASQLGNAARALNALGYVYFRNAEPDRARAVLGEGLAAAESVGDDEARGMLLINLATVERYADADIALEQLERAALAFNAAEMPVSPRYYWIRANIHLDREEFAEADAAYKRALADYERRGDRRIQGLLNNNLALLEHRQGRYEQSEAFALRALALRESVGDRSGMGRVYGMLANIYSSLGEPERALEAAENGLAIAIETQDSTNIARNHAAIAGIHERLGDVERASDAYRAARDVFEAREDQRRVLEIDLRLVTLARGVDPEQAARLADDVVERAEAWGGADKVTVQALELRGRIARDLEDNAGAIGNFEAAMAIIDRMPGGDSIVSGGVRLKERLARAMIDALIASERVPEAEPMVGYLAANSDHWLSLVSQAQFALAKDDVERAIRLAEEARERAADDWTEDYEQFLRELRVERRH